jgi:hypothetical protein
MKRKSWKRRRRRKRKKRRGRERAEGARVLALPSPERKHERHACGPISVSMWKKWWWWENKRRGEFRYRYVRYV